MDLSVQVHLIVEWWLVIVGKPQFGWMMQAEGLVINSPKSSLRNESRESEGLSLWNAEMYSVDFNMKEANTPGCKGDFFTPSCPKPYKSSQL